MAFMHTRIQVEDYDTWKQMFDQDPPGARREAKGHRLFRGIEEPNEVLVTVEFPSADEARAARERLYASGVLKRVTVKSPPTITEEAEAIAYQR